jgi:hypothetical protein
MEDGSAKVKVKVLEEVMDGAGRNNPAGLNPTAQHSLVVVVPERLGLKGRLDPALKNPSSLGNWWRTVSVFPELSRYRFEGS